MYTIGRRRVGCTACRRVTAGEREKGPGRTPDPFSTVCDPGGSGDQLLGRKQMPMRPLAVPQLAVFAWLSEAIHSPAGVRSMSAAPSPRPRFGPVWERPVDGVISPSPDCARAPVPRRSQPLELLIHRW